MPSASIEGGDLTYEIERDGSEPPIILLHPVMMTRDVWDDHLDHLTTNKVVTADLRGHGETGGTDISTYDYDLFVDDLATLVEEVEGTPVLVGCSLGAETALHYAREHPEEITRIVAAGVAPRGGLRKYLAMAISRLQYGLTRLIGFDRLSRVLPAPLPEEEYYKFVEMMMGQSASDSPELASLVEDVSTPVTLVRGPSEEAFDSEVTGNDQVAVATLPNGGHIASVRHPSEFVRIIDDAVN